MTEMPPDSGPGAFTPEAIKARLTTTILGGRIELHQQVGSTNDLVREAARQGAREGLIVLAEEQVTGRGRLGRAWVAPAGCCILCSVLLRPRFSTQQAFYLTVIASLAIYRAVRALLLEEQCVHSIGIKWPNDVLLNGRKLSGVLSEGEFSSGDWAFSVVGFGINVNLDQAQLGPLVNTAASLSTALGHPVDRTALLARVLGELESLYFLLQNGQFGSVHAAWVLALETLGKHVSVADVGSMQHGAGVGAGARIEGRALRVDPDGALVVLTRGGVERRVLAGDVQASSPGGRDQHS